MTRGKVTGITRSMELGGKVWGKGTRVKILDLKPMPATDLEAETARILVEVLDGWQADAPGTGIRAWIEGEEVFSGAGLPLPKHPANVARKWVEEALKAAHLPKPKRDGSFNKNRTDLTLHWEFQDKPLYNDVVKALAKHPRIFPGARDRAEAEVVGRKSHYRVLYTTDGLPGERIAFIFIHLERVDDRSPEFQALLRPFPRS